MTWTRRLQSLLNLFLQSNCPLCQRPASDLLCQYCTRQLQHCQLPNPCQFWSQDPPVFAWGAYGGSLKRTIATLKYENFPELAKPLGYWMGKAWLNAPISAQKPLTVVPIPIHPQKLRKRGFNQAELLARSFCEITSLPLQPQGLERIRETEAQFGLSAVEREKNLAGAFAVGQAFQRQPPKGSVILLDDIYTTGTTVRAAIRTLQTAQIPVYGVVALATPKRDNGK